MLCTVRRHQSTSAPRSDPSQLPCRARQAGGNPEGATMAPPASPWVAKRNTEVPLGRKWLPTVPRTLHLGGLRAEEREGPAVAANLLRRGPHQDGRHLSPCTAREPYGCQPAERTIGAQALLRGNPLSCLAEQGKLELSRARVYPFPRRGPTSLSVGKLRSLGKGGHYR